MYLKTARDMLAYQWTSCSRLVTPVVKNKTFGGKFTHKVTDVTMSLEEKEFHSVSILAPRLEQPHNTKYCLSHLGTKLTTS